MAMKKLADISAFEGLGDNNAASDISVFNTMVTVEVSEWYSLRDFLRSYDEVMWRSYGFDEVDDTGDEDKKDKMFEAFEEICDSNPGTDITELLSEYGEYLSNVSEELTTPEEDYEDYDDEE